MSSCAPPLQASAAEAGAAVRRPLPRSFRPRSTSAVLPRVFSLSLSLALPSFSFRTESRLSSRAKHGSRALALHQQPTMAAPPPPRRATPTSTPAPAAEPAKKGWKAKANVWGLKAFDKVRLASPLPLCSLPEPSRKEADHSLFSSLALNQAMVVSDAIGVHANNATAKLGGERWWPTTDDFPAEVAKCVRILRAFTVDGIEKRVDEKDDKGLTKQRKVFRKIPAEVIRSAKGIVVYTSFRTGVAPLGGAGGSGVILARLPDGSACSSSLTCAFDDEFTSALPVLQAGPRRPSSRRATLPQASCLACESADFAATPITAH